MNRKEKAMSKKQNTKSTKKVSTQKIGKPAHKAENEKTLVPAGREKATAGKTTSQGPAPEPKGTAPSPEADPRLPAVGTVIQKRDRHGVVRCECTVEKDRIRYGRTPYRSISSAALAAARDLGLKNKTQNLWCERFYVEPAA